MKLLFIVLTVFGVGYFAFFKRRFDFYSLAFFSAVVYFLPGFFGFALSPDTLFAKRGDILPLVEETYAVFCLVLLAILGASLVYDQLPDLGWPKKVSPLPELALWTFLGLSLLGFGVTVVTIGDALLAHDKNSILAAVGRWRTLWVGAASLAAVTAFVLRRWWILGASMALLLVDLYVGFRNNLALAIIALFVAWLHQHGRQRLAIDQIKIVIPAFFAALSFFVYKHLYQPIKVGDWDRLWERLGSWELLQTSIISSEPFTTQALLNEVLVTRFRLGMEGLADVVYGGLLFAPSVTGNVESVHDVFRAVLFPGAPSSMASNIWGEMWSRGDWPFLMLFLAFFVVILAFWSTLLRSPDPMIKVLALLNGGYWAFYIHRNTLLFQVTLHKRVVLLWLVGCGLAFALATLRKAGTSFPGFWVPWKARVSPNLELKEPEGFGNAVARKRG